MEADVVVVAPAVAAVAAVVHTLEFLNENETSCHQAFVSLKLI